MWSRLDLSLACQMLPEWTEQSPAVKNPLTDPAAPACPRANISHLSPCVLPCTTLAGRKNTLHQLNSPLAGETHLPARLRAKPKRKGERSEQFG